MIRPLLTVLVLGIAFASCLKSKNDCDYDACAIKAPASEIDSVKNYLTTMGITAVQHCSGVFYAIDSAGTGNTPNPCSYINANYVGKLKSGVTFDSGSFQQPYQLTDLVRGWTNTVPLIKNGGKIRIYVPPSLGYGNQAVGTIPANSILIFDIKLTAVQ